MGLFDKLFKRTASLVSIKLGGAIQFRADEKKQDEKNKQTRPTFKSQNENCLRIKELKDKLDSLLSKDCYIPKSEYVNWIKEYTEVVRFFDVMHSGGMMSDFCTNNSVDQLDIEDVIEKYNHIEHFVDLHNDEFIKLHMKSEKEYLDNVLKVVDPVIQLDDDQRKVVLTDEDYCLVIAGAGAGKTTTVAAKVKYLVDKKNIEPSQILVVSFTNKAVKELKEKINDALGVGCPIATFHSTGNAIIHKNNPEEQLNIVDNTKMYFVVRDYFRNSVMQNESMVNNLILFFASYFDAPYEGNDLNVFFNKIAKANFTTMKSELEDFKQEVIDRKTKKSTTIQSEFLRSYQEVEIANFLYLNNIDYEYEPVYRYNITFARKPYTPDFMIKQGDNVAYLEHFGVTQNGNNNMFSDSELESYKNAVNDKVKLHREHGTTLIYTFSSYNDGRPLLVHLKEELERHGFVLNPRSNKEVMETLIAGEENRYIKKLLSLICRFISNFKVNGYGVDEFNRMYHSTQNVRSRLFLNICNDCYLEYERWLKENKAIDFEDMINESARLLREVKEMKKKLDFKYVIVDEYQDISRQRFDLTTALSEVTDAKIIAVGDDWQSIYAFSGSDITLFTKFQEKMGYAKMLKIVNTYRNSQEVIDIAGNFIQKNKEQIQKQLISPKRIENPVIIYTYDGTYKGSNGNRRSGANYAMAYAVQTALEQIIEYRKIENKGNGNILLLGRFGFDGDHLERSGLFEYVRYGNKLKSVKYPNMNIDFMTAHASKGLGYDDVIIVNGKNETYGFPSKIEDDPVLSFVIKGDHSIDYAEERRLFYVAMTRTKNRVYCVAPEKNPSEFLLELKHDYKNVVLKGNWSEKPPIQFDKKPCPLCGYPMQYRYKKAYGLKLLICTNEPEICGFMTNNYSGGKLAISKCDKCRDGYLIVKSGRTDGLFLGCTNYMSNGKGCGNTISKKEYYTLMGYDYEPEPEVLPSKESKEDQEAVWKMLEEMGKEYQGKNYQDVEKNVDIEKQSKEKYKDNYVEIQKAKLEAVLYMEFDLNDVLYCILQAHQNISINKYFGVNILIEVLRGGTTEMIIKNQLNLVAEYGKLKKLSYDSLRTIVDWMITEHLILKTKGRYPVLHSTYEGLHYSECITVGKLKKLKKILEEEVVSWE